MPRQPRIVIPGVAHHINQRGNDRPAIFRTDAERGAYLNLLGHYATRHGVHLLGYCLMTDHVHLVAVPGRADSLARMFGCVHSAYSAKRNRMRDCGTRLQSRFFSCPLEQSHLLTALRYVDQNPVRAGLVSNPIKWRWSSAKAHCVDGFLDPVLDRDWIDFVDGWNSAEWGRSLSNPENESPRCDSLRHATVTGQPYGSRKFVIRMEKQMARRPAERARGECILHT